MASQSLAFGYTTSQTLTAQLFAIGSDTVVATASSVTEATNRKGRYVAAFTDVAAGDYLLVYFLGGSGAGSEKYTLTLTTATFEPWAEYKPTGGTNGNGQYQINLTAAVGATAVRNVRVSIDGTDTFTHTGTLGTGELNVDAGTYTLIVTPPAGYEDVADIEVTVTSADEDVDIALTATTVTVAEAPYCATTLQVLSQYEGSAAGVAVAIEFIKWLPDAEPTGVVVNKLPAITSDADGLVSANLFQLAKYKASYRVGFEDPKVVEFSTPAAGTYAVVDP